MRLARDCGLFGLFALYDLPQPVFAGLTPTARADLRVTPEACLRHDGAQIEQPPQISVAHLGDAPQPLLATGGMRLRRDDPELAQMRPDRVHRSRVCWRTRNSRALRQRRTFGATVRAGAGFHADQTGRQALENLQHLAAPELASRDRLPFIVDTVQLKNTLRQIDPIEQPVVWNFSGAMITHPGIPI
jgi:hypothetical protein